MSLKGHTYGRLTKDPEVKISQNNVSFTQFSIAIDNGKNQDGSDKTVFIDISAFNKQGELIAQSFKKGHRIVVDLNNLEPRAWINQQTGQAQATLGATLAGFDFVETKSEVQGNNQQQSYGQQPQQGYNQAPQQNNVAPANQYQPPQQQNYGQPPQQAPQPPQNYGNTPWG